MDASTLLGTAALIISILAFVVSGILGAHQVGLMRDANHIPAVVDLLSKFRDVALHDDYYYVTERLRVENDPQLGISGLPAAARKSVTNVAFFFQTFAFLIGFGILDERKLYATALRRRIVVTWRAIEPYVLVERATHNLDLLAMLEALCQLMESTPDRSLVRRWRHDHKLLRAVSGRADRNSGAP